MAVTYAVMASVAALTTASAAASAASSSASSATALMGAQRFSIYGDAAQSPSLDTKACKGDQTSLLLFRYSFWSGIPSAEPCVDEELKCSAWAKMGGCTWNSDYMSKSCRNACGFCGKAYYDGLCDASLAEDSIDQQVEGRRLRAKKRAKRRGTPENAAIVALLATILLNNLMTYLLTLLVTMFIHSTITNAYRYHFINGNFYKAKNDTEKERSGPEPPLFRSLPNTLVYPRFELMLHILFATGLVSVTST